MIAKSKHLRYLKNPTGGSASSPRQVKCAEVEMEHKTVKPDFKTTPFKHQLDEFENHAYTVARAVLWEQGTGKSKLIVDTGCELFRAGKIDGVLLVAPNGVHRNWIDDEIPTHLWDSVAPRSSGFFFQAPKADTKQHKQAVQRAIQAPGLSWFAISYDAFVTKLGKQAVIDFMNARRILYVLDESHKIKTPDAARTKTILKSAKFSDYRRILTGTPIANGPFDAFSQLRFLEGDFWKQHGLGTFTEYKQHFGIWRKGFNSSSGRDYDVLVAYRRLDQLADMLAPISSRVTKDKVLDLLPKSYQKRYFAMSPEQARLYAQMRDECVVWLSSGQPPAEVPPLEPAGACLTCAGKREVEFDGYLYPCGDCAQQEPEPDGELGVFALEAMTKLLRLQQIACGYLPNPEGGDEPNVMLPGVNRRLELLMEIISEHEGKLIVWARFTHDIDQIMWACAAAGISAVRYDGRASDDERAEAKARLQGERTTYDNRGQVLGKEAIPPEQQAKVFVGNPSAGSAGLTLHAATLTVYYSNSFKLIDRLQSEDRNHRIGQNESTLYIDLVAEDTVDSKIVEALRNKQQIAALIQGDNLREWI